MTTIELDDNDCAIVFYLDGDRELVVPQLAEDEADAPMTAAMLAMLLCTVMLDDPQLRHMVQERTSELLKRRRQH